MENPSPSTHSRRLLFRSALGMTGMQDLTDMRVPLAALDRWLDELSERLGELPPLPADFSRPDLYDDHD
jgi:hypothetical protein